MAFALILTSSDWTLLIDAPRDPNPVVRRLKENGGYAFTHVAQMCRSDGSQFKLSEATNVLEALRYFLSFVNGSRVGWALPVGFGGAGDPVWSNWAVTVCDEWSGRFTWHDDHTGAAQVAELFPYFMSLWSDQFWQPVLMRSIGYYLEGNDGYLEKRLVIAFAALEMLAWAVLVEDEHWLREDELDRPRASSLIRLLLKWATIPTAIPVELAALTALSRPVSRLPKEPIDGPRSVAMVRNRIVHPRRDQKVDGQVLTEAWLLTSWYLELVLLRVLRYDGQYASRLIRGRFSGTTEPVPWASPSPSATPEA